MTGSFRGWNKLQSIRDNAKRREYGLMVVLERRVPGGRKGTKMKGSAQMEQA